MFGCLKASRPQIQQRGSPVSCEDEDNIIDHHSQVVKRTLFLQKDI